MQWFARRAAADWGPRKRPCSAPILRRNVNADADAKWRMVDTPMARHSFPRHEPPPHTPRGGFWPVVKHTAVQQRSGVHSVYRTLTPYASSPPPPPAGHVATLGVRPRPAESSRPSPTRRRKKTPTDAWPSPPPPSPSPIAMGHGPRRRGGPARDPRTSPRATRQAVGSYGPKPKRKSGGQDRRSVG